MDTLLSILAVVCGLTGVAGCFLPVLPGPPVAYLGLLLVHWTDYAQFSGEYLALWAVLTGAVTLADYLLPAWITGRLGGSRQATRGGGHRHRGRIVLHALGIGARSLRRCLYRRDAA